jgi:peptidoglycan/LPS O-acetylase OafA/YrhL
MHRDNNFNLIRTIAALAVLVAHAYPIAWGPHAPKPLEGPLELQGGLGTFAVVVFFIVSGYFITQSALRAKGAFDFWTARVLRIYPGLFISLFLTALLGVGASTLSAHDYFSNQETYTYVPFGLSLVSIQYSLPGVFESAPFQQAVNGSLWTLFYEVLCYVMVSVLASVGLLQNRVGRIAFFVIFLIFYVVVKVMLSEGIVPAWASHSAVNFLTHLLDLTPPFVIGMLFYLYRDRSPLNIAICAALVLCTMVAANTPIFREMLLFSTAACVFYLGFRSLQVLRPFNSLGDYSYGIYIYAFPIEQFVAHFVKDVSPAGIMAIATPITVAVSAASWHTIEAPALSLRARITSNRRPQLLSASTKAVKSEIE